MTKIVDTLPVLSVAERAALTGLPKDAATHADLLGRLECLSRVQVAGRASGKTLSAGFSVAAWNLERCLFPQQSAAHLARFAPDVVLLSEMDWGMARTAQRHTTQELAAAMNMQFVYGVEFLELSLGGPTERQFCSDDFNACGWHGNAIMSSVPFDRVAMVRLDTQGHWYVPDTGAADPEQPRIGGRNAILAVIPTVAGPVCFVSTHLESNAGAAHRHDQFARLLGAIDDFAPMMPVVIGGDLNTGNHLPPDFDWRRETLFDLAQQRGYSWDLTADGMTTRPSLITPHPDRVMKLDWFCTRGVTGGDKAVVSSIGADGTPLSDHDLVWTEVRQ